MTTEEKDKFNISGSNGPKDESSKISEDDNKAIINLNIVEKENDSKSKIINEKSEELENNKNNSKSEESSEKNKSGYNYKNTEEKEGIENNEENEENEAQNDNSENAENKSSFLNSNRYNIKMNENDEMEESNEENFDDNNNMKRNNPFMTTGKFMQIQPHFNIFSKQINDLRDGIYDNTKKCLMYKCSLQQSENLMREKANSIVKDMVEKIFNLRQMFLKSNKEISNIIKESNNGVERLKNIQDISRQEIKECDFRINNCEGRIGYKLLGKPNYSFMKRVCNTTTNK